MRYGETLKRVMSADFSDASEEEKARAVREVILVCSVAAGAVTVQPIPLVDTALISPIQIAMVQAIGRVHGYTLDRKSILEMLSTFGAGIVAQNVIMAAAKLIPFLGQLVTISMAYALTWAVGEVADRYFGSGRRMSKDEMSSLFQRVYKQKKEEKQARNKARGTLKERLEKLKKAYEAGQLSDAEFEARKEEILRDF